MTRMGGSRGGLIAADPKTHVISVRDDGALLALCGLGAIVRRLPGDFQVGDPLNCQGCDTLLAVALTRRPGGQPETE